MQNTRLLSHIDGLYNYAMVLSLNPKEAGDLVQETYLRTLQAEESLLSGSSVKCRLLTILRNIWLNRLQQGHATSPVLEIDPDGSGANLAIATFKGPDVLDMTKIEREQVRKAIQQLPLNFREVIILREHEELSYQEIASLLDCPPQTVISRLARARAKLRSLLSVSGRSLYRRKTNVKHTPLKDVYHSLSLPRTN
jgi:RNA polymerase sigma-70 factor, ECF subfamily